jgi:hypothetical protein
MRLSHYIIIVCTLLIFWMNSGPARGQSASAEPSLSTAPPISRQTRMDLTHALIGDMLYVRVAFPAGEIGLKLERGSLTPQGEELEKLIAKHGSAAKPGDPAFITALYFRDRSIVCEINGGPVKKPKWYERIEVGSSSSSTKPIKPSKSDASPHGSYIELVFDRPVPEMTSEQLKKLLQPIFDFNSKSPVEAFLEPFPPKAREAVKNHTVLVGMNGDLVLAAKGQPGRKVRETEGDTEYEEWIYGEPPQEMTFVRFLGDEVVRLETITVDGKKTVKTEKEVDLHETSPQETPPPH